MVQLKRVLGLFEVSIYGVGIILGAGIYALIGEGAGLTGNSLWISFVIGAIIASFTGLSYAELATMFPKSAAEYVYVRKAFSSNILAFLIGWLSLLAAITTIATVSLAFAGYFGSLFHIPVLLIATSLILILSVINYLGIKESSHINTLFTLVEVSGLVLVIILAFFNFRKVITTDYMIMTNGIKGVLSASALVFFAYLGFEDIANIAEETRNPRFVLSWSFIIAVAITAILYILTSISTLSLATPAELHNSNAPLALAVSKTFLGNNAFVIMSIIALFSTANTVLVTMIVGSRMLYGMGKMKTFPSIFAYLDKTRQTPRIAIVIFAIVSILFVFIGGMNFVANMTSFVAFLTFAFVNVSLLLLRFKYPNLPRTFRSPINIGNFSVLAFLGLIASLAMLTQFNLEIVGITLVALLIGLVFYFIIRTYYK